LTLKAGFFKRRWVPNSLSNDLENVTSAQVGHVYYYRPLKCGRAAHPLANMFTTSCNLELGMVLAMSGWMLAKNMQHWWTSSCKFSGS
jgi:hypothetical protein